MAVKVAQWGADIMRYVEKSILLQTLDHLWREHLVMLEHLRQVIGLRGYGQRDPLNEYKAESFNLFEAMSTNLREVGDRAIDARRDQDGGAGGQPASLPYMEAHKIDPSTGEDELALARAGAEMLARHGITAAARVRPQSERSDELGQGRPQRGLPLRLRQEIQALPRAVRVSDAATSVRSSLLVAMSFPRVAGREHGRTAAGVDDATSAHDKADYARSRSSSARLRLNPHR